MENTESCLNCGTLVTTAYCSSCGQPYPTKKLNLVTLWFDFQSRIYGFDGMFPRTLRDLTIRPGEVAKSYINGNRVRYYGPVGYFFIILTIYVLLASLVGVDLTEFTMAQNPVDTSVTGHGQVEASKTINAWIIENMRLVSFLIALWMVPFLWMVFKRSGYNIVETSVLAFFTSGHVQWLSIIFMLVYAFTGYVVGLGVMLSLSFVYTIFSYASLYNFQAKWKIVLRALVATVLSYFFLMVATILIGFVFFKDELRPSNNRVPATEKVP